MSEVTVYLASDLHPGEHVVLQPDYDSVVFELSALRGELARLEGEIVAALPGVRFMDLPDGRSPTLGVQVKRMSEALTAAEQRNAELSSVLEECTTEMYLALVDHAVRSAMTVIGRTRFMKLLQDHHTKPTESGASE